MDKKVEKPKRDRRVWSKAYYQLHKEKIKEYSRVRGKFRKGYFNKRYQLNKERNKRYAKDYYKKHNQERVDYARSRKTLHRAFQKEWRKKNLLKCRTYCHNRRNLIKDLKLKTIQLVYEDNIKLFGTLTCYLCLKPIPFGKDHLEHKNPVSRGGNSKKENLEIACNKCNSSKRDKTVEEFLEWRKNVKMPQM